MSVYSDSEVIAIKESKILNKLVGKQILLISPSLQVAHEQLTREVSNDVIHL